MGLKSKSIGRKCARQEAAQVGGEPVIALAGNPNVGKSTVFNAFTKSHQHTGNWPGKTVASAQGRCTTPGGSCWIVDLPGTYSLLAHSAEEEIARDFLCFGAPDGVVVVCDATCLERNLNLVLQTLELTDRVVVCVNLMDEARRKGISVSLETLSRRLGVPVVGCAARNLRTLKPLLEQLDRLAGGEKSERVYCPAYPTPIEGAVATVEPVLRQLCLEKVPARWLSLRLLEGDETLVRSVEQHLGCSLLEEPALRRALDRAWERLERDGISRASFADLVVSALVKGGEELSRAAVTCSKGRYDRTDRRLDKLLTSRLTGYPVMLALLAAVFWLTITGANYPSELLGRGLFWLQARLTELFAYFHTPEWLHGALVLGAYRTLAWVVSVMLPPMAIFFPLFTLLEDVGYLPRVAYNLDQPFQRCSACGKQSLTMAMGFGCNAAGVVGCRIIDSPRERLLAILTNSLVPCNGRFPTLITLLTMFFVGASAGMLSSVWSALLLTGVILLGVAATLGVTKLLSMTLLKGMPSSFALELPPYRRPQVGQVIVRSMLDRTLFVLGRAASVAAPAGLLLWILANVQVGNLSVLQHCANALDPFARLMGLDGVILIAFILGFPANEIVLPIILMAYLAQGTLVDAGSVWEIRAVLAANGWTWVTAASVILFSLMHWPCSTTLLTIRKETGSWKWTGLAALIPTVLGVAVCTLFCTFVHLVGLG